MSEKHSLESERQSKETDLKTEVKTGSVTAEIYNVQNRLENVNKRIKPKDHATQQGADPGILRPLQTPRAIRSQGGLLSKPFLEHR